MYDMTYYVLVIDLSSDASLFLHASALSVGWSRWYHWCLKFIPLPEILVAIFSITTLFYDYSTVYSVCIPLRSSVFLHYTVSSLWIFFFVALQSAITRVDEYEYHIWAAVVSGALGCHCVSGTRRRNWDSVRLVECTAGRWGNSRWRMCALFAYCVSTIVRRAPESNEIIGIMHARFRNV